MQNLLRKTAFILMMLNAAPALAELNIAFIAPMKGSLRYFGNELRQGAQLAVDEVNSKGGLNGEKVNFVKVDDPCDDAFSLTTAQMMAVNRTDYKMAAVFGPYCPNKAEVIAEIFNQAKIVQILPMPVSEKTYKKAYSGMIKFSGFKKQMAYDFAKYFSESHMNQPLAMLYDPRNAEDVEIAEEMSKAFDKLEITDKFVPLGIEQNLEKVAEKIGELQIAHVYIAADAKKVLKLAGILKKQDENVWIFADKYQVRNSFAKNMGKNAHNTALLSLPNLKENPNFAETLVFMRLLGFEPEGLTAYGYLSVKMWVDAVEKVNSIDYQKVVKAMNAPLNNGWGAVVYKDGNPNKSLNFVVYEFDGKAYTQP